MTNSHHLDLVFEGEVDKKIATSFLKAAGIPMHRLNMHVVNGSREVISFINSASSKNLAALIDLDENSNYRPDLKLREKYCIHDQSIHIFAAIPTIEAWLFSDIEATIRETKNNPRAQELLSRVPMPDEIPYPKMLAKNIFRKNFDFIEREVNIEVAMSRSPSLRTFITGVAEAIGYELTFSWEENYVRSEGRDIFSKLVNEIIPAEKIIYRTLDGQVFSAHDMIRHIKEGTDIGIKYSVDVLRIARDMLAREARKK